MRKGSQWLLVSETFQSISGGEGVVTGGQSGGCHMVRTRKWRELDQRQGQVQSSKTCSYRPHSIGQAHLKTLWPLN